jgi:hypothetical protein
VDRGFFVVEPFQYPMETLCNVYRTSFQVGRDGDVEGQLRPDVFITRSAPKHG